MEWLKFLPMTIELLEKQLDSFESARREEALTRLLGEVEAGRITLPAPSRWVNLHAHTFFSYNAYGYSPTKYAWLARKSGLVVAGVVDFDVLDALEEFLEAGRRVGLKTCVSLESRVYVPEFSTRVINSPGEPGIAYHMGAGFTRPSSHPFLKEMREAAARRTREMVDRVNAFLHPVELDYCADVEPLTPRGNATERHLCEAYQRRAAQVYAEPVQRQAFWQGKLGDAPPEGAKLQNLIRAKTMKKGGVGYVQPGKGSFPLMADMNRFVLDCGAIPTLTWLDGTSEGEQSLEELFEVSIINGAAALNIIPDRNYTPGVEDQKVRNLYQVVEMAEKHHLPVIVGTEMNAPGNKFVDSFDTKELSTLLPVFLKGAHILYAHSVLQRQSGLGYLSPWAKENFSSAATKNDFFEQLGRQLNTTQEKQIAALPISISPSAIIAKIK